LLAAFGILTGCVDDAAPARTTPVFSHKLHVIDQELKCFVCHKTAEKADLAGMPTMKNCTKCHEGIDAKKPPEKRIDLFLKDGFPVWTSVTAIPQEVKFSHKTHIDAKVECATCHNGIEQSKEVTNRLRVDMKACIDCHVQTKVGGAVDNCYVCHRTISKQWKPENHLKNWREQHGHEFGFMSKANKTNCDLCHTPQSCTQCHREIPPKNHNNYWRQRGHAVMTDLDRHTCKVCHTEDSCLRCHQSIAPQSHRANWESQHCLGCHEPLKNNGCFACHKNDKSHLAAPHLPNNKVHANAKPTDCRGCHFGLKLHHIDNGDNCLSCHQR
jgi:c(7)-type cytochrome triheme protein